MNFLLASANAHKAQEFQILFREASFSIEAAQSKVEVIEDAASFEENAFKKARAYYEKFKMPAMSDDSGLVVSAMPDKLGVDSAYYAPDLPDYKDKCHYLLEELGDKERSAHFVCVLCFYLSPGEVYFFEGRISGEISREYLPAGGFGYDPIFLPEHKEGKSLAQLSEWKQQYGHRAKAATQAIKFFNERK